MRILLFHDSKLPPPNYGGIERIVVALSQEYSRLGHSVTVLCQAGSKIPNVEVIEIPRGGFTGSIEDVIPKDIDFIHSHQPLNVEPERPYLVTIHGNGHEGERYFANTNFLSQSHARNHGSEIYVFNGVDLKRHLYSDQKKDYFLFLARTTWRVKNLKTVVNWATDLNVKLKIIGGNGISRRNIEYLGFVSDEEKNHVLSQARALVYPTNWDEPCAGAPLESLACGTPVISSGNGCMPEMVSEETGVICKDYSQLLKAYDRVGELNPLDCRTRAEKDFSVERMALDYLKLMTRIIEKGNLVSQDRLPKYSFNKESVEFIFKPTLMNNLQFKITGKI
jgi:glycosyltransferase involved in cell wall biosynthesis